MNKRKRKLNKISYDGISYIGRRKENQDTIISLKIDDLRDIYYFAVADGMGGAKGGKIASSTVINATAEYLRKYFSNHYLKDEIDLKEALKNAITITEKKLCRIAEEKNLQGFGTTLTCILTAFGRYVYGNIGDSRIYFYNSKKIKQITKDHSANQEYLDNYGDDIDPEILKRYSNVVTRVLQGQGENLDIYPMNKPFYILEPGSGFLLCSDGMIIDKTESDNTVKHSYLIQKKKLHKIIINLIGTSLVNGSTDNISIVLFEYGKLFKKKLKLEQFAFPPNLNKHTKNNKLIKTIIILFSVLSLLLIVYFKIDTITNIIDYFNKDSLELSTPIINTNQDKEENLDQEKTSKINNDIERIKEEIDESLSEEELKRLNITNIFPIDQDVPLSSKQLVLFQWESSLDNRVIDLENQDEVYYRLMYQINNKSFSKPLTISKLKECVYKLQPGELKISTNRKYVYWKVQVYQHDKIFSESDVQCFSISAE